MRRYAFSPMIEGKAMMNAILRPALLTVTFSVFAAVTTLSAIAIANAKTTPIVDASGKVRDGVLSAHYMYTRLNEDALTIKQTTIDMHVVAVKMHRR